MFEDLSARLDGAFARFLSRGVLDDAAIAEGMREVRRALLEADVHYQVAKDFCARVAEKAKGEEFARSIRPGQLVVKIVHDELVELLGGAHAPLVEAKQPPTIIVVVGLQGSGKTTTAGKLARLLGKRGRRPMLVAADVHRPAAIDQLETLGRQLGLPVVADRDEKRAERIVEAGLARARAEKANAVLIDTAGRLHVDEEMMAEVERVVAAARPTETLLVADGMAGQDAVRVAEAFAARLPLTGIVLTKMDGDARGGAALSIHAVTGLPIKFVGMGERLDALEPFHPDRMAGRILDRGDVVTLVERAQEAIDVEEAAGLEEKVGKHGRFDLEDFLVAMKQIKRMGPLEGILGMLPGVGKQLKGADVDPDRMKRVEAIVLSMTPAERRNPKILDGSRRKRIARGSGTSVQEVNRLLKQFGQMNRMMKQIQGTFGRKLKLGR
ncbi:MAG TPA: signal recognition particle protein [Gemmatimonadota bacterium]|nr:signal recognition particle protein [Gemmatimonadota bacterium]